MSSLHQRSGILTDVKDSTSLLHYTDLQELDELDDNGAFSEGMRPRLRR